MRAYLRPKREPNFVLAFRSPCARVPIFREDRIGPHLKPQTDHLIARCTSLCCAGPLIRGFFAELHSGASAVRLWSPRLTDEFALWFDYRGRPPMLVCEPVHTPSTGIPIWSLTARSYACGRLLSVPWTTVLTTASTRPTIGHLSMTGGTTRR